MRCRCRDLCVVHVGSAGLVGTAPPFVPGFPVTPGSSPGQALALSHGGGHFKTLANSHQGSLDGDSGIPCERRSACSRPLRGAKGPRRLPYCPLGNLALAFREGAIRAAWRRGGILTWWGLIRLLAVAVPCLVEVWQDLFEGFSRNHWASSSKVSGSSAMAARIAASSSGVGAMSSGLILGIVGHVRSNGSADA